MFYLVQEVFLLNNQIANPKVEVPTGMKMNDKDYITSLLSCLKEMEKNYTISMTEASNENLYEIHKGVFFKIANLQRKVYELMFCKGWYCLEKAEQQKIEQKYQTLSKEYQDMHQ